MTISLEEEKVIDLLVEFNTDKKVSHIGPKIYDQDIIM